MGAYREAVAELRGDILTPSLAGRQVVALGKAAGSMAASAAGGFIVGPGMGARPGFVVREGGHPLVDESSLAAGEELLGWVQALPDSARVVGLLSGGASAMLEALQRGVTLSEMRELTRRAFAEGWDIQRLNQERAARSRLKGGGLARALEPRLEEVYVLSDVPLGQEKWVGSGPFWDGVVPHHVVGTRETAARAMVRALERRGIRARSGGELSGSVPEFFEAVDMNLAPGEAVVWHGELTLETRGAGVGGRCQHLVLLLVERLSRSHGLSVLAAGTDGRDGPTEAAGAWADSARAGALMGAQRDQALADCDSGSFLAQAGQVISRFDSGTNLNDLVVLWRA